MLLLLSEEGEGEDEDEDHSPLSRSPQQGQGLGPLGEGDDDMGDTGAGDTGAPPAPEASSLWVKERAQWDRKTKLLAVDNRFLQEEVEKKDGMLGLLTRGLKEVETSQQQVCDASYTPYTPIDTSSIYFAPTVLSLPIFPLLYCPCQYFPYQYLFFLLYHSRGD